MQKVSENKWKEVLRSCGVLPQVAEDWALCFSEFFDGSLFSAGDKELVPFLANIIHESQRLSKYEESLYYTAERMVKVWPTRFPTVESAKPYEKNPRMLAGRVYGNRLGNKTLNDSWEFRGSGLIMITGRDNFEFIEKQIHLPVSTQPDLLRHPGPTALAAALAWWEGKVPDSVIGDTARTRAKVNGGDIGLVDVTSLTSTLSKASLL